MSSYVELREKALAKGLEVKEYQARDDAEPDRLDALTKEFLAADAEAQQAAEREGNAERVKDRLNFYQGKAGAEPMQFARVQVGNGNAHKSVGQALIESDEYRELVGSTKLTTPGSRFETGMISVSPRLGMQAAATDVINTETGEPAAIVPNYRMPGLRELQQAPLAMRQVLDTEDMPAGDTIEYAAQVGFDNAAAAVAQATDTTTTGAKPQSSIAFEERTAPARWIATWMAVTRQTLSDLNVMRAVIDNQGRLMIRIEEDRQILLGNGTAPNLTGILDDGNTGLQTLDLTGLGDDANLDGIRTARRMVRTGLSRLAPSFVVVNPVDSEEFDLLKDLEGRYRAGDPFAFGGPDSPPIWRLPRVESEAITEGTALVGARGGATIFEREPLTVEIATQHADFFVRNLVVVLFEERVALPIWFPTAFVEVTLSAWAEAS